MTLDWLKLAESLQQVANVASMETHLPGGVEESSGLPQQGKKAGGTLWDQEKDEMSVRILLEVCSPFSFRFCLIPFSGGQTKFVSADSSIVQGKRTQ